MTVNYLNMILVDKHSCKDSYLVELALKRGFNVYLAENNRQEFNYPDNNRQRRELFETVDVA